MDMVWEKCPGIAARLAFGKKLPAPFKEITPVGDGDKDRAPLYPPYYDMMENTGGIETEFAGHEGMVAVPEKSVKISLKNLRASRLSTPDWRPWREPAFEAAAREKESTSGGGPSRC
jgi:hypothetical protein